MMKCCKVSDLFHIYPGNGFELNALIKDRHGVNFIARGMKDNGVVAKVCPVVGFNPFPAGAITVAASGSVMESFLQKKPFYTSYHVFVLIPREEMSDAIKLFYCMCLRKNKFKYSYGRQANETLADLQIPIIEDIPSEVTSFSLRELELQLISSVSIEGLNEKAEKESDSIKLVPLSDLFILKNGLSSDKVWRFKVPQSDNWIPFIRPSYRQSTSIDSYVNKHLIPAGKSFPKGTLYVSTDGQGSHSFSYVSVSDFVPNSNVCVLIPKRKMCLREKLFYAMCITKNRFKFSYGRKPKGKRLESILLPQVMPTSFNNIDIASVLDSFAE
ncbi:MAG: restriction endonuclease subunit S [Bacteroides sp.]|nr:restriction endonuclease subunit S [Bacteroides sp.]